MANLISYWIGAGETLAGVIQIFQANTAQFGTPNNPSNTEAIYVQLQAPAKATTASLGQALQNYNASASHRIKLKGTFGSGSGVTETR